MNQVGSIIRGRKSRKQAELPPSPPGSKPLRLARPVSRALDIEPLEQRLLLHGYMAGVATRAAEGDVVVQDGQEAYMPNRSQRVVRYKVGMF